MLNNKRMEWGTTNGQYGDFSRMDPMSPAAVNINVILGRSINRQDPNTDNGTPGTLLPGVGTEHRESFSGAYGSKHEGMDAKDKIQVGSLVPDRFEGREVFAGASKSNIHVGTMRPRSKNRGSSSSTTNNNNDNCKSDNNRPSSGTGTRYGQPLPSPTSVADAGIRMGGGSMSPKPPEQPKPVPSSKKDAPLLQLRAVGRGYQKPAKKKKTTVAECKQVMQMLINTYVHPKDRQRAQDFLAINGLSS